MRHGAKQSTTLVDSTGKSVEVVELIVDYARVGTVVVRVCRASSTGWSTGDDVVAETVEEHRGPATGDVLSPGSIQFFLEHGALGRSPCCGAQYVSVQVETRRGRAED